MQMELDGSNSRTKESYNDPYSGTSSATVLTSVPKKRCYGNKCRLLQAKGIILRLMLCATGRNMCSGYLSKSTKLRRLDPLENEIMILKVDNSRLAPLLQFRMDYTSIKTFRQLLSCLPTFSNKRRDDHSFGAARYLANALGIKVYASLHTSVIDSPMTVTEMKQVWRKATFFCRCVDNNTISTFENRSFCNSCTYLVPIANSTHNPACRFASIVFQNPFAKCLQTLLNTWIPAFYDSEYESSCNEDTCDEAQIQTNYAMIDTPQTVRQEVLVLLRKKSINDSLDMIRSSSSAAQNRNVLSALVLLQKALFGDSNKLEGMNDDSSRKSKGKCILMKCDNH
jgi:hypothetical protein